MRFGSPLAALLLVAVVLAGCSEDAADPVVTSDFVDVPGLGNLPATDVLVEPAVLQPTLLGGGSGEPNIAVAPDGTIYVVPIDHIYRSRDGGASWVDLGTGRQDGGGDGDIYIDGNGTVHWLGLFGDAGPIPYQNSSDGGLTFSEPVDISNETGADREWITGLPNGTLYASWRDGDEGGIIATRTSFDGGLSWQPRATMAPDGVGGPIVAGPVAGTVYEAYTTFASSPEAMDSMVMLARSADHGKTWESVPVAAPPQSAQFGLVGFPTSIFPVVAADTAGTLYVVYAAEVPYRDDAPNLPKPAVRTGVYLTVSQDNGNSWTDPLLISDASQSALMPFIDAGAPGRVAIVWYENVYGNPNEAVPDLWNVMLWESINADQAEPESVLVQLSSSPNHIGAVCTSGTGCLASDRSLLDFFEVAITPAGQPVVTWASSVAGTGVGIAAQDTQTWFGGAVGVPLR